MPPVTLHSVPPARPNPLLPRIAIVLCMAGLWALLLLPLWRSGLLTLLLRTLGVAVLAGSLHTLFDRWPVRLGRTARRRLQWGAVMACIPLALLLIYLLDTGEGRPPLWRDLGRLTSYYVLSLTGLMLSGLALLGVALRRERQRQAQQSAIDAEALTQAQRELHDAQLRLLRAQLRPQLVLDLVRDARERVRRGAPDADAQLGRLLDYLQGALPQMDAQRSTLEKELEHASAYLGLLTANDPGTLRWQADVPEEVLATPCPPRLLMVLVEQAVRLGLQLPGSGGWIDLWARVARGRCVLRVTDSGRLDGARRESLEALRRRLLLAEGEGVRFQTWERETGGTVVEVDFTVEPTAT